MLINKVGKRVLDFCICFCALVSFCSCDQKFTYIYHGHACRGNFNHFFELFFFSSCNDCIDLLMTLESKNYFGFDLIYLWSNISIYFHQYVVKCPLTSCISIRLQMSGITVAGYLTTVLG